MTRQEYCKKWSKECLRCSKLTVRMMYDGKNDDNVIGSLVACYHSDFQMEPLPDSTPLDELARKMVLDEKNISPTCSTYADRMVELYNLED